MDSEIINLNIGNEYKNIVHMADIHIPNDLENGVLQDEYNKVLNNVDLDIQMRGELTRKNTCIIIAGDIFDMDRGLGNKLHPNAIAMFKTFIKKISKRGTLVLIAGNHDNNITHQHKDGKVIDILSSVINDTDNVGKDIFYLRDTGRYKLGNLLLYHTSVFDIDKTEMYEDRLNFLQNRIEYDNLKHIGILHCSIDGQTLENGFVLKGCAYRICDLEEYDICCLGDTHKQQFLGCNKNIGYPNSLVQQNQGESLKEHGYILWDLGTFKGTFYEIPNEYGYVTVDLTKDLTINDIIFAKSSRIRLIYNIDDNLDLDEIRREILEKTKIISWKEVAKDSIYEKSNKCIDEELSDDRRILKYINVILPGEENSEIREKILKKLNEDMKDILDNERLSCKLLSLRMEDFQGYKGSHSINFEDYEENSSLSIIGKNYSGKSTIIDALGVSIWGPDSGKGEFLINNKSVSKCTKLELVFLDNQENKKYKIERNISKKKAELKLSTYNDKRWDRASKTKTDIKKEIDKYFGKKEHAKQTWFSEQGTFNSFITDAKNYNTFQEFIGADKFTNIHNKSQTEKKNKENEIKINKEKIDKIIISEINIGEELENEKDAIKKSEIENDELEKEMEDEIGKKSYGSKKDILEWIKESDRLSSLIKEMEKENKNMCKNEYNKEKEDIDIRLKELNLRKDELNRELPKLIKIDLDKIDIEIDKNNLDRINSELVGYDINNIKSESKELEIRANDEKKKYKKYKRMSKELENKKKELGDNEIDMNNLERNKENLEELKGKLLVNKTKIGGSKNIIISEKENNKLKKIEKEIVEKTEKLKKLENKVVVNIPNKLEIEEGYEELNKMKIEIDENKRNIENVNRDLEHCRKNIIKHSSFSFDNNCKCCIKNKDHLEINKNEETIKNDSLELEKLSGLEISYKAEYDKLVVFDRYKKKYENNKDITNEIKDIANEIRMKGIDRDELNNRIEESIQNKKLSNEVKEIGKKIKCIEVEIKSDELNASKLLNLRKDIDILNAKLEELEYNSDKVKEYEKEYNELKGICKLVDKKKLLEELIENIKQKKEYDRINNKIGFIENDIKMNEMGKNKLIEEYEKQEEIKYRVNKNEELLKRTKDKIENYNLHGGYDEDKYQNMKNNSNRIKNEIKCKIELICELTNKLKIENKNREDKNNLEMDKIKQEEELNLLKEYCLIVNPRSGYPHSLIEDSLKLFTNLINNFIRMSGYEYELEIEIPEYNVDSKKQDNKLNIKYKKDGNIFIKLSGAEMAIFNIAIQTSLGKLLSLTTPPIQIIDEGFSPLDKEHINEIPEILNSIKTQFNLILYISHDEFIRNKGDYCIKVRQDEHGNSTFKQLE
jgi:exonuclease SbcC